jgi:predicted nuclease of predicted toxin-antitoxin system
MPSRKNIQLLRSGTLEQQSSTARLLNPDRPALRVFLDAGVPDSVGETLEKSGHVVILYRQALPERIGDDVVCTTALANDAILLAIDPDMKSFPKRYGISHGSTRYASLSLIWIGCNEVLAAKRLEQAMSLIEHEWQVSDKKASRRLWIEIGPHHIRTHR